MKDLLIGLWEKEIACEYQKGNICSERHLQAELFSHLKAKFISSNRRVWVEPMIRANGHYTIPDLVITNGKSIEVVVELKYVPYHCPRIGDIKKLAELSKRIGSNETYNFLTDPLTGDWNKVKEEAFTWLSEPLFVFGVICRGNADALNEKIWTTESFGNGAILHLKGRVYSDKIDFDQDI